MKRDEIMKPLRDIPGGMMKSLTDCLDGILTLDSWAGRTQHTVKILKETPTRYKVLFLDDNLKGKRGDIKYVPKYCVRKETQDAY